MNEFMQKGTGFALYISNGIHGVIFDSIIESLMPSIVQYKLYRGFKVLAQWLMGATTVIPMIALLLSVVCLGIVFLLGSVSNDGGAADKEYVENMNGWTEFNRKTRYDDQGWYQ